MYVCNLNYPSVVPVSTWNFTCEIADAIWWLVDLDFFNSSDLLENLGGLTISKYCVGYMYFPISGISCFFCITVKINILQFTETHTDTPMQLLLGSHKTSNRTPLWPKRDGIYPYSRIQAYPYKKSQWYTTDYHWIPFSIIENHWTIQWYFSRT